MNFIIRYSRTSALALIIYFLCCIALGKDQTNLAMIILIATISFFALEEESS